MTPMTTQKKPTQKTTTKPKAAKKPAAKKKTTKVTKGEHVHSPSCGHEEAHGIQLESVSKIFAAVELPKVEAKKKKNLWEKIFRFRI